MPLAFGLHGDELNASEIAQASLGQDARWLAKELEKSFVGNVIRTMPSDIIKNTKETFAYLVQWEGLLVPAALYEMLFRGLIVKVSTVDFK
jgi:hypothetical protein